MSNADTTLSLVSTQTGEVIPDIALEDQEPVFPPNVDDWTDVLDCRHEPYTQRDIEKNCRFAEGVRKKYILVDDDYLENQLDEPD